MSVEVLLSPVIVKRRQKTLPKVVIQDGDTFSVGDRGDLFVRRISKPGQTAYIAVFAPGSWMVAEVVDNK